MFTINLHIQEINGIYMERHVSAKIEQNMGLRIKTETKRI